jgi:hypothetical protein
MIFLHFSGAYTDLAIDVDAPLHILMGQVSAPVLRLDVKHAVVE